MKINESKSIILTEAGKNIGFGHLTRCIALYQAFEQNGNNPELIINGDKSILGFVKDKKYQIMNWIKREDKITEIANVSDIVVIDSYLAPKSLYDNISNLFYSQSKPQPKPLLMIDDYQRIDYPQGIVVNPSIYGDKLDYPKNDQVEYLLGKDYIILRKEFWDVPEKIINKDVKHILITLGGIDKGDFLKKFLKFLSITFPDFNYHVITNSNLSLNLNLNLNLYSSLSAQEMRDLMLKSDICISGGGQTTYELARVGVPAIGICFADNQMGNLRYGDLRGYLRYVGDSKDDSLFNKIKDIFEETIPFEERAKMSRLGRDNVDGKGAERIMETVINANKVG
jgi:spore coat polysaccharide biosynthesis predicted glycosyltransferase SpsG